MTPTPDTYEDFQAVESRRRKRLVFVCVAVTLLGVIGIAVYWPRLAPKESALAVAVDDALSEPFAELPNGVKVEIIGLAPMVANPVRWWKPDGSTLESAPKFEPSVFGLGTIELCRCLIHVRGVKDASDVTSSGMSSASYSEDKDAVGNPSVVAINSEIPIGPKSKTGTFRIGIAAEPWSPIQVLDVQGKRIASAEGGSNDLVAEDIEVTEVAVDSSGTMTNVWSEIPMAWERPQIKMAAIDAAGTRHDPIERGSKLDKASESRGQQRIYFSFRLLPAQIDHFEYQFRIYRHWVTFENISLEPGYRTAVRRKVTSVPQAGTAD